MTAPTLRLQGVRQRYIVRVTLAYVVFALAWIFLSDRLLGLFANLESVAWVSTAKGVFFVLVSTLAFHAALQAVPADSIEAGLSADPGVASEPARLPRWLAYGVALALVVAMLMVRLALGEVVGEQPMLVLFTLPIAVAALVGGLGPGLLATVAAALLTSFFVIDPVGSLWIGTGTDLFQWGLLIGNGLLVSVLSDALHRSRQRDRLRLREVAAVNEALQRSQAHAQRLFDDAPVAMALSGREGQWVAVNRRFQALFAAPQGRPWSLDDWWVQAYPDPVYRAEVRVEWAARVERAREQGGDIEVGEYHIRTTDGRAGLFEVGGRILPEGLLAILTDISARREAEQALAQAQAEALELQNRARIAALNQMQDATLAREQAESALRALRESEGRLALFVEHAPAALAMFDLEMRYVAVSRRWLEGFGLGGQNLIGRNHYEVFPEIREEWRAVHRRAQAGEVLRRDEDRFERADGTVRWVRWEVRPWRSVDGQIGGIVVFTEDISAHKAAEEALQRLNATLEARVAERTAQLEALNQSLESFVYSVSHDLKAPLRGVEGYSRFLQEDHAQRLDEEGRLFIANIRSGVARMGELIDDLLAYSRMERRPLHSDVVDLGALLRRLLAERGVQVELDLPAVLCVQVDADGLALALRNLLENAIKFSARSAVPHIAIAARVAPGRVTLSIRDNGIGFDMKYHDRIFEIFQRLHRLEDYPGTGIGLALVKKALERMGGRVWAESAPGQGATFHMQVPAEAAAPT
jgi:PAS domain S-box-containing protein